MWICDTEFFYGDWFYLSLAADTSGTKTEDGIILPWVFELA